MPDPVELEQAWTEHTEQEFVHEDVDATMRTMTDSPHVLLVPVGNGGRGREGVRCFYSQLCIGRNPEDFRMDLVSRTVGTDRLVDEMLLSFTHDIEMPWILPGVAPTGRRVEIPLVAIVTIRDGLVHSEHLYWDQASVLAQVGQLDPADLAITGTDQSRTLVDETAPLNRLAPRNRDDSATT